MPRDRACCGHFKGSYDNHDMCPICRKCMHNNPCDVCSVWPQENWDKLHSAKRQREEEKKQKAEKRMKAMANEKAKTSTNDEHAEISSDTLSVKKEKPFDRLLHESQSSLIGKNTSQMGSPKQMFGPDIKVVHVHHLTTPKYKTQIHPNSAEPTKHVIKKDVTTQIVVKMKDATTQKVVKGKDKGIITQAKTKSVSTQVKIDTQQEHPLLSNTDFKLLHLYPVQVRSFMEELYKYIGEKYPTLHVMVHEKYLQVVQKKLSDIPCLGEYPCKLLVYDDQRVLLITAFQHVLKQTIASNLKELDHCLYSLTVESRNLLCIGVSAADSLPESALVKFEKFHYSSIRYFSKQCVKWYSAPRNVPKNLLSLGTGTCFACRRAVTYAKLALKRSSARKQARRAGTYTSGENDM